MQVQHDWGVVYKDEHTGFICITDMCDLYYKKIFL